jgi:branched-chain amino acid transport system substrate-binding protein
MKSKKIIVAALSTAAILVGAGCAGTTAPAGDSSDITIGGLAPLTGDGAGYGVEFQRIAEIALADINEAWADKGMTLDIQWEDGACNGKDASTAAAKLVDIDKVEVILGGFCSSETLAAAPITEAGGVILFSPGSSSPDVSDAGDYVYRNWPSDAFQGQKMADLASSLGYGKIAVISEQQDYTLGISRVFTEQFEAAGGEVAEEFYLSEDTDYKTQLTKLNQEGADAFLINPQTPVKSEVIIKQMQELGIEGPFLLNDVAGTSTEVLSKFSDYLEGSSTSTPFLDEDSAEFKALVDEYTAAYSEGFQYQAYGASVYDATWILANALAEVGNDSDAVQAHLNDFPGYTGLMGATSFDSNGDPLSGHSVFMISGGELQLQ